MLLVGRVIQRFQMPQTSLKHAQVMTASSSLKTSAQSDGLFHQIFSTTQFEFSLSAEVVAETAEQMEPVG